jgi:hypothetical protein
MAIILTLRAHNGRLTGQLQRNPIQALQLHAQLRTRYAHTLSFVEIEPEAVIAQS